MNFDRGGNLYLSPIQRHNVIEHNQVFYTLKPLSAEFESSKGGNSSVFLLEDSNENVERIIKVCKFDSPKPASSSELRQMKPSDKRDYYFKRKRNFRFSQEIEALNVAKQEGFLNIVEIFFDGQIPSRNDDRVFQYFVMEKADTDLKEFIISNRDLEPQERLSICIDIMKAVKELHGKEIYHRDIKPDNILLFNKADEDIKRWKLSDLGLIYDGKREGNIDAEGERIGPYGWLSPEAMNKVLTEKAKLGFDCLIDDASDIFQLGKVFWFIFQGNVPIGQIEIDDFQLDIKEKIYLFNILKNMLQYSKSRRNIILNLEEELQMLSHELLLVNGL
jgi:serine/threonine protein kinase